MFKPKPIKKAEIDTLVGAKTRINGDVEFVGGFHLDGYINGNVKSELDGGATLSVSEQGCIEGSVIVTNMVLNGIVKGDIMAGDRVELGPKAQVLGSVHYTTIETAVGAQINGKLIHRVKADPGAVDSAAAGTNASPKDSL
jgi:cytoskeletal protein CcmA (bactofilin family)